jgi:hypothetical protein
MESPSTATNQVTSRKTAKIQQLAGLIMLFKEEHDFSDELYGNWIKILGLNQVRKEKEKQRRQHLEDVRNQREEEKATTEGE